MSHKDYDHLERYVEKEKTRELINEAVQGGTIADSWRQVLTMLMFAAAVGGVFFSRTQRFKEVMDTISHSVPTKSAKVRPQLPKGEEDPDKLAASAEKTWAQQEKSGQGPAVANPDVDGNSDDLANDRKARDALAKKLENISEGKAAPQGAANVEQAMYTGAPGAAPAAPAQAPAPTVQRNPASAEAGSAGGIGNGEREAPPMAELISTPGAPVYRQLKQLPAVYARDKQEFPDFP